MVFALPPAEVGIHPGEENGQHQLYLLCDDIETTAQELERPFHQKTWGRVTAISLPGGGKLGLYQPTHPLAHARPGRIR